MGDEVLLCKECKHGFQPWESKLFLVPKEHSLRCKLNYKNNKEEINPVVGTKKIPAKYELCSISRMRSEPCGPDGKMWQPLKKQGLFKLIKKESY